MKTEKKWIWENTPDQGSRSPIVAGADTGIGFEAVNASAA